MDVTCAVVKYSTYMCDICVNLYILAIAMEKIRNCLLLGEISMDYRPNHVQHMPKAWMRPTNIKFTI